MIQTATKIYCEASDCKFCNEKGVCTEKSIALSWHSVMTKWDGRQEFNRCKSYEMSDKAREYQELIQKYMQERGIQ